MWNNNSFRIKLLKLFLSLTLFSIFLIVLYGVQYFRKRDEINNVIDRINKLNINLIMKIKRQSDFIKYDAIDTNYYITGTSSNLEAHQLITRNIYEILNSIEGDKNINELNIKTDLDSLKRLLIIMNTQFNKIISEINIRGFKDFGVEGEMRKYAHRLENSNLNPNMVLMLRRHEKDYIIRKEPQYIDKLNNLGNEFRRYITLRSNIGLHYKDSVTEILNKYLLEFNNLIKLESEIGLYKNIGIKQYLEALFNKSEKVIEQINTKAYTEKNTMFRNLELNAILFFFVLITINILLSIFFSKHITNPLNKLTEIITRVTESNFTYRELPDIKTNDNEILILISEFKNMLKQLKTREGERDHAEAALRDSENKYRNLADMLPQSIFETDSDCYLTYFNKTMINTFGYNNTILENKFKISEILGTECEALYENENQSGIDFIATKMNGEKLPILLYVNKIIKDNTYIGLRGILVDITEKKRYTEELEEQKRKAEQADQLKSSFLANMSHEIRTPLNCIVGFSQLLSIPGIAQETRVEYVGYINQSSDLLLKIINDILDIAKIESGQFKITYSSFNLNSLMNKIGVEANEIKKIKQKDFLEIKITTQLENKEFLISSDSHRLEQVIGNLISNAIKFTNKGSIEAGYRIINNNKLEFYVKDSGIGIAHDKLDAIFERFIQIEEVSVKKYEGTGLGLSISKSIIDLLEGKIWVESVLNQGSTFYFEIPLITDLPNEYKAMEASQQKSELSFVKGAKILIAEDVDFNFIFLREGLKSLGLEIIHAKNGLEVVRFIEENPEILLVLMDMRMPVMDGYEASKRIKKMNPHIKIIAITANAMSGEKDKCLNSGCDHYMSKPIKITSLVEKIVEMLAIQSENEHIPV